jgi:carbonic anhydrase/acetyltransferase-like protein (isoleucine patch superfamily)
MVAPMACIRADSGGPVHVGADSFIGDMVSISGFATHERNGAIIEKNVVFVGDKPYSVYIGKRTHVFPQCGIHGPVILGEDVFVMSQSFLMMAIVERNVIVEPDAKVIGVRIAAGRIVPAGAVVKTQEVANGLPRLTEDYPLISVSRQAESQLQTLREGYLKRDGGGS